MTGKRDRLRVALAAALLSSVPLASGAADLKALTDRSDILGWEAVGRIDSGSGGFCTGVLIAPDLVLTAAHCLFASGTAGRNDPTKLVFHAGYRDGDTIASIPVARAVVPEGYDPTRDDFLEFLQSDIGLLQLEAAIPATTADPFVIGQPGRPGTRVTVVSYGESRNNAASRQSGCRVTAQGKGVVVFDCAGEPGSSGAPIFDTSGRSPRIVSLISGGGPYKGRPSVFGAELPRIVADLKRNLRAGIGVWPEPALPEARRVSRKRLPARSGTTARFLRP